MFIHTCLRIDKQTFIPLWAREDIRQHTSAYVCIRQHASAYVSSREHTSANSHTSLGARCIAADGAVGPVYVRIRQHT